MTDIHEVMKAVLVRDCAVPVYYENLPTNGVDNPSYIRFQRISTHETFSHSGRTGLHRDRIQVTCIGRTHADLIAVIALMESSLYLNNSDFKLCFPLEGSREIPDGANTYQKDFFVFYT
jgi:hypothetical protein